MKCKKCGSENTTIQLIAETKKRNVFSVILWITLGVCSCGLLLIPLLRGRKSETKKYLVCNNCGYKKEI